MKINIQPKTRRGLSSIVGALIFVVLMVATFSVLGIALNSQSEIVDTNRDVSDLGLKKQQENFIIKSVLQNPSDVLQINVANKGQNPAEIFTLIITNSSDIAEGYPTRTYNIPSVTSLLASGASSTDIVKTLDLTMDSAAPSEKDTYSFKIISSLGTIKKLSIECDETGLCGQSLGGGGSGGLAVQLFLDGPNGVNTKTSTVIMFVSNIGDVPLEDIRPVRACPTYGNFFPDITDAPPDIPGLGSFTNCLLTPLADTTCGSTEAGNNDGLGICLEPGQTALYKWDGVVGGDIGDVFQFCNEVVGQEYDNTDVGPSNTDCDELTVIDPNDCGGCGTGGETIILIDDLLIRPSIFMTIPSPFGDSTDGADEKGLWGVNVANPTDRDMTISKVTIVAFPPGGDAKDVVFNGAKSGENQCLEEDILPLLGPSPGGYWDCPRDNTVMWQNFTSPVLLPANSTKSFMLKVEPGDIFVSGRNLDALIVQANVYSTFGSFGKSGYQTTMYERDAPIVNVYLTDAADLRTGFIGNVNDIANFTSTTFNAVLADLDDNEDTFINSGARFIINVPREWTFEEFISCDGFDSVIDGDCDLTDPIAPTFTLHSDGSTQIIAETTSIIGDGITDDVTDPSEARKISFKVTSAPVKFPRLYVMYILADGIVSTPDGDRTIGPLSEVILNVDP